MPKTTKPKLNLLPDLKFIEKCIKEKNVKCKDKLKYYYQLFKDQQMKYDIITEENNELQPLKISEFSVEISNELNNIFLKIYRIYNEKQWYNIIRDYDKPDTLYTDHHKEIQECFIYLHMSKIRYDFYNKYPLCYKLDTLTKLFNHINKVYNLYTELDNMIFIN